MSEFPGQEEDPQINPALLLGHYDETDTVRERYTAARQNAAENLVSVLRAEDSEYKRRQSLVNAEYLEGLRSNLPAASLDANTTHKKLPLPWFSDRGAYYHGTIKDLNTHFDFVPKHPAAGGDSRELLADIAGVRATTIWINRPVDEALSLEMSNKYASAEFGQSSLSMPYILVGHRPQEDPQKIDTLLMPLAGGAQSTGRWNYTPREHAGQFHIGPTDEMLTGSAVVGWKNSLLVSTMSTKQYSRLIALQDTLLDDGLSHDEVGAMHDAATGAFVMRPGSVPLVQAKHRRASTLQLRDAPTSASELNSEEFDIHITEQPGVDILPETFENFNVLADTQRAAAMLGRYSAFERAKDRLVQNALADPAIRLVQE